MKKAVILFSLVLILLGTGCHKKPKITKTIEGNLLTYYEMSDGTWK